MRCVHVDCNKCGIGIRKEDELGECEGEQFDWLIKGLDRGS